jgi:hypothetical protein
LCVAQRIGHLRERRVTDDEDVDVAVRPELAARRRPVHESRGHSVRKRRECLAYDVDESRRLAEDRLQLTENGAGFVGLEVHMAALCGAANQACVDEELQLSLNRAVGRSRLTDDLPQVIPLVGMAVQPGEHLLPSTAEEDRRGVARWGGGPCTHPEYKCTRIEYGGGVHSNVLTPA